MKRITATLTILALASSTALAADAPATQPEQRQAPLAKESARQAEASLAKGLAYLSGQQEADGSWVPRWGPAVTAMVVKALVQGGEPVDSPRIGKAVGYILASQKTEGPQAGAFVDRRLATYNTSIVLSTLAELNVRAEGKPYDKPIRDGLAYLRRGQWDAGESVDATNGVYGGFGYENSRGRPDLSNTAMAVDAMKALKDAGYLDENDPMFEKARRFIQSCQNNSETNKASWGKYAVGDDGGFIYVPASSPDPEKADAQGKAEQKLPGGQVGLRSYGTMTYAGFKSFLYTGLTGDDPRVKAAMRWIARNYTLAENPGMPDGRAGLYYYYHLFARGLAAAGTSADVITDPAGVKHRWREDLIAKLSELQRADGSWVNAADRWEEGNPALVTCYCVLALQEATTGTRAAE